MTMMTTTTTMTTTTMTMKIAMTNDNHDDNDNQENDASIENHSVHDDVHRIDYCTNDAGKMTP
jgi:hypothetical protein